MAGEEREPRGSHGDQWLRQESVRAEENRGKRSLQCTKQRAGGRFLATEATGIAEFRRQATAMNEGLVVSSVRQHELIETIQRGEQDRLLLQARLFHAQKLESLGVLAGGIAHDLNNMLTPVLGFAELASDSVPRDSPAVGFLEEVRKSARLAADLVQQILAFAGKGRFVFQAVELSGLIREMSGLLSSAVSIHIDLRYDLASALPHVEADATQLRQVVMNLVTNASEAIGAGVGTITLRTGLTQADHLPLPSASSKVDLPGRPSVFLEVTDSGCGMSADVIEKIFDPFFTTKFTGRGLGLAVVQGIARGHGGEVQVHSEVARGTTFRLLLPISKSIAVAPIVRNASAEWRGKGTILVIDDEKGVRAIAAHILEQAGLTVLLAADGQEGLRMFCEHPHKIDAVVVDLTMPRMGGREVAAELRGRCPDLPVILMSGFSVQEVTIQSTGLGITGFVQKPFSPEVLLAAVRDALGQ